ncbi:MAG: hypothetical protein KAT79_04085 [candidate division Zixibacteria bacterium]|nr:hypothetical protein [candidate division Zixibacteria bacterium]
MIKKYNATAAERRERTLLLATKLVSDLEQLSKNVEGTDARSMPVDFRNSLRSAKRLREMLERDCSSKALQWDSILQAVIYLIDVVERIHSSFNCQETLFIYYERWIHNKAA